MKKVFEICYAVVNPNKKNATSIVKYKKLKCNTKFEAHNWFIDHVQSRGTTQKKLIEIVELTEKVVEND